MTWNFRNKRKLRDQRGQATCSGSHRELDTQLVLQPGSSTEGFSFSYITCDLEEEENPPTYPHMHTHTHTPVPRPYGSKNTKPTAEFLKVASPASKLLQLSPQDQLLQECLTLEDCSHLWSFHCVFLLHSPFLALQQDF